MDTRNKRLLIDELHYHSIKNRFYPNNSGLDILIYYLLEPTIEDSEVINSSILKSKYRNFLRENPEFEGGLLRKFVRRSIEENELNEMFEKDLLSLTYYFAILVSAKSLGFINIEEVEEFQNVDQFIYKLISSEKLFLKTSLNILPSQLFLLVYKSNLIQNVTEECIRYDRELTRLQYNKINYSISGAFYLFEEYNEYPTNSSIIGAFMGDLIAFESIVKNHFVNNFIYFVKQYTLRSIEDESFIDVFNSINSRSIIENDIPAYSTSAFIIGFVKYLHYINQLYVTLNERSDKPLFKLIVWSLNSYLYKSEDEFCSKVQAIIRQILSLNSESYGSLSWEYDFDDQLIRREELNALLLETQEKEQNLLLNTNDILSELETIRFIYDTSPASPY